MTGPSGAPARLHVVQTAEHDAETFDGLTGLA